MSVAIIGAAVGIASIGVGIASQRGAFSSSMVPKSNPNQQLQSAAAQIATDQNALAAAQSSQKTWEYIAIGGGAFLVLVGGVIYLTRQK